MVIVEPHAVNRERVAVCLLTVAGAVLRWCLARERLALAMVRPYARMRGVQAQGI
jgi:hypothetical protein